MAPNKESHTHIGHGVFEKDSSLWAEMDNRSVLKFLKGKKYHLKGCIIRKSNRPTYFKPKIKLHH
jgi:hypothetical protein